MDRFWKYKLDQMIFWVATIGFHMYTRLHLIGKAGLFQFFLEVIIRNGLLALLIYTNLLLLIPRYAARKKAGQYLLLLSLTLGLYVCVKNIHDVYLHEYIMADPERKSFADNTYYNLSIAVFYLAFSVALYLSRQWYDQLGLIRKIEIEKLNTELAYLRAQINPHFLFNSINTIYFLIEKNNAPARQSLSAFSQMLRYQLYECNGNEIPIEKELNYLKNYVDLQRLRKDDRYTISFAANYDSLKEFNIAPLLLIPFVENAFKHVSDLRSCNEISISLEKKGKIFEMDVVNSKDSGAVNGAEGSGIGLTNVKRRLALLYGHNHMLSIEDKENVFRVNLQITLP